MLSRDKGFTLIELMLAMGLGLAILAGTGSLATRIYHSQRVLLSGLLMEQEVNRITSVIAHHLAVSGFHGDARQVLFSEHKKAEAFILGYTVSQHPKEADNSCLLFAYDTNDNGILDTSTSDERKGFRLRDKTLEMRVDGKTCEQTGWQDLTQNALITIEQLNFTPAPYHHSTSLQVNITLALKSRPQVTRTTQFTLELPHGN
ncbi:prepilin-type N-terminal cleavage/methylation domain-containing protein [Alteromonas sp. C1M14]|uniref:prepilin-type N-terminal cleavage/methylation domain-containing protein n=1 Tax=Alteromonas sp. C1M14 TaxID=2841567 RepID=UPI001C09B7A9|nr:prepilin-type N-terminal cleavage/methylation domain-containing protein [Alteromonas sp. C1M14]MBU2979097.1 prepilin-type N-terminal cleavage/methylation domain-containing protein [Alteromonas sp. C1M14]